MSREETSKDGRCSGRTAAARAGVPYIISPRLGIPLKGKGRNDALKGNANRMENALLEGL